MNKRIYILALNSLTLSYYAQQPASVSAISGSLRQKTQQIQKVMESIFKYDSVPGDPFHTRIYTLPNGLKAYLSPYHVQPKIFTMIAIKAGSKYDPPDATGLAHYLEHMLFKGTDQYGTKNYEAEKVLLNKIEALFETYRQTKDEQARKKIYHQIDSLSFIAAQYAIANEYDKMTASIGANYTNAFTSNDETVYVNEIPSNQIDNWLDIESERFRNPVFRLFHTELEAVYEEKNRTLDNDEYQAYEALFNALFPNHPYGTQTTIGTIEHLKNPSLKEIKKYYATYYVPNNMAIIMSGDFNPDSVISKIFARFGNMPAKPLPALNFTSPNLTQRIQKTIYGPQSELLMMGWKTNGAASKDRIYLNLLSNILYNGKTGLIDKNVTGKQKVLKTSVFTEPMKDYCALIIEAEPKENQSLEEVEKILIEEIHHLQKGEFDDQLLKDIITNKKLELQHTLENHINRAYTLFSAFTKDIPLYQIVHEINELKKITKADVMHFAQQYLRDDNYAIVYKKTGTNHTVKVTKPPITPVEVDKENTSPFAQQILKSKPQPIAPKFIDFKKDIQLYTIHYSTGPTTKTLELLYNQNKENDLFELTYYFQINEEPLKKYDVVFKYLNNFPSSETMNTESIYQKLYQLGCHIDWSLSKTEQVAYLTISGLSENMEPAIQIAEDLLNRPKINPSIFEEFKKDLLKERQDNKKDKNKILSALSMYAIYGHKNVYCNVLNNAELNALSASIAEELIKELKTYPHQVLYYGTQKITEIKNIITRLHTLPAKSTPVTSVSVYSTSALDKGPTIYYTPYPMQQAEFNILSKITDFDHTLIPVIELFNNYFGGNMSSVVFQEIREAKALAYSAYSYIRIPPSKYYPFINYTYVGTQADKLSEALPAISHLLDSLPYNQTSFEAAKEGIIQQIRTERITKTKLFFEYLKAQKQGLSYDIRKDIFEQIQKATFRDLWTFHKKYIHQKPRNIAIIGDENKLDKNLLKSYGSIQPVSLEQIFGY